MIEEEEANIDPQLLKDIRKNKYIRKGHGLNPDNITAGEDGVAAYLKSLLPQVQINLFEPEDQDLEKLSPSNLAIKRNPMADVLKQYYGD